MFCLLSTHVCSYNDILAHDLIRWAVQGIVKRTGVPKGSCTHTHTHTRTRTHTHTHTHTRMCTHTHARTTHAHTHINTHMLTHTCSYSFPHRFHQPCRGRHGDPGGSYQQHCKGSHPWRGTFPRYPLPHCYNGMHLFKHGHVNR